MVHYRLAAQQVSRTHKPLPPLQAAGCMISEAGLLVHGGRGADGDLLSDILIFDGRAGRWVLAQDTGVPRCAHTACNAAVQQHAAQQPAASGGPADSSGSSRGGGGGAAPGAANVLLFGGFDGEGVADDLLQLTFKREQRGAGGHGRVAGVRDAEAALLCDAGAACPAQQHLPSTLSLTTTLPVNAPCPCRQSQPASGAAACQDGCRARSTATLCPCSGCAAQHGWGGSRGGGFGRRE